MRPALVFKRDAGSEIRRLFLGPLFPRFMFNPALIKLVPYHSRLRFQTVHSFDVAEAFRLALHHEVRGAFNLASGPALDSALLAAEFHARQVPVSQHLLRGLADVTWRLRLQHSDPGWIDLGLDSPLVSPARAQELLGWQPRHSAIETLRELMQGMRDGAGLETPPLAPPGRVRAAQAKRTALAVQGT